MGQLKLKVGETALVVNEKGELCELTNFPIRFYKGKVIEVDERQNIESKVIGLVGKYGSIHFTCKP